MPNRDIPLHCLEDIYSALRLLTRLPIPAGPDRGAAAVWAYPLAGLAVGAIGAGVAWLAGGLPAYVAAGLALTAMIFGTGALHEDGLADSADGLWCGGTHERRLEVMRDSRVGAYGVLALILSLGLRWAATAPLLAGHQGIFAIVAAAILSRAPMGIVMWALPHARADGLSAATGRPSGASAWIGVAVALFAAWPLVGAASLAVLAALGLAAMAIGILARHRLGGQTGDILGFVQQVSEIAALIILLLLLTPRE